MIDRIYNTVQTIANKDVRGNMTPEEFNLLLNNVIQEKYEEYFFELNRALNRQNRGLSGNHYADVPARIREKLDHYYASDTATIGSDTYPKPADCRYVDYIEYSGTEVSKLKNGRSLNLANQLNLISASRPAYHEVGARIVLLPDSLTDDITIYYLRNPLYAKWTYDQLTGLYNPDATDHQDVDMVPSEEEDIVRRLLTKFGINLKDTELAQYGIGTEQQDFNEENAV